MTIEDFKDILAGIRDGKCVSIPYNLHCDNQLQLIIEALGGPSEAFEYFDAVSKAEPASIKEYE